MDKINAVVIIIHGTNQLDLVSTNNEQGKLLYYKDLAKKIGFLTTSLASLIIFIISLTS
jgi:hypothetical protein